MKRPQSKRFTRKIRRWLGLMLIFLVGIPLSAVHRFAFWLDRFLFPKLSEIVVRRPLFIIGPPRSGTTVLHRLLAENDEQFTTFQLWELILAPALCEKYALRGLAKLDRFLGSLLMRGFRRLEMKLVKSLESIHPTSLFLPEEDYLGLLSFRGCFLMVLAFPKSDWVWRLGHFSTETDSARQAQLLGAYEGLLKRHLCFRGSNKTVLSKNASFCSWIPLLLQRFPDARFIGLLRDPKEMVPSQLSSVRSGLEMFGNDPADVETRNRFVKLLAADYHAIETHLGVLPSERAVVVDYKRLKDFSGNVVLESLEQFGYQYSDRYVERVLERSQDVRKYRSGHQYSLSDYGLSESELEAVFSPAQGSIRL